MNNIYILGEKKSGKTQFLCKAANLLSQTGYNVDFVSFTEEIKPELNSNIEDSLYPNSLKNIQYFLDIKREKISSGKLDFLIIDDFNFRNVDSPVSKELLNLDCKKFVSLFILTDPLLPFIHRFKSIDASCKFHVKDLDSETFLKPYLRDKIITRLI